MDRLYVFCLIGLLFSTSVVAIEPTSEMKIVFSKGDNYKFNSAGLKTNLKKGSLVDEGDTLYIASDGLALLKIPGHSLMKLDAGSELVVEQLPAILGDNEKEVVEPALLKQIKGAILIEMEQSSDNETLQLRTKSATLGVRGTKFLVATDEDVTVAVNEGTVEIENDKGQADFLTQSESMVVENGQDFTARQKFAAIKNINWDVDSNKTSQWRKVRKSLRENFRKKRKNWSPNKVRYESFSKRWKEKRARGRERIQKLLKNPKFKKRFERIQKRKREGISRRGTDLRDSRKREKSFQNNQDKIKKRKELKDKIKQMKRERNRPGANRVREMRRRRRRELERRREDFKKQQPAPSGTSAAGNDN